MDLAAVDAASGAVDPAVDPQIGPDSTKFVRALWAGSGRIYAGGTFGTVDGVRRANLAAFDLSGNLDTRWKPRIEGKVASLAPSCDGSTLFAGGKFRRAASSGQAFESRETIARYDLVDGVLQPWKIPDGTIPEDLNADDLAPTCSTMFVGYAGTNWAYAIDVSDDVGDVLWNTHGDGDVQAVALYGDEVLLGGHFTRLATPFDGTVVRTRFAAFTPDGHVAPWAPAFSGRYYGPWDILVTGRQVWVGGNYTIASGVAQVGIARFTEAP
jgi:hypothetical protein